MDSTMYVIVIYCVAIDTGLNSTTHTNIPHQTAAWYHSKKFNPTITYYMVTKDHIAMHTIFCYAKNGFIFSSIVA